MYTFEDILSAGFGDSSPYVILKDRKIFVPTTKTVVKAFNEIKSRKRPIVLGDIKNVLFRFSVVAQVRTKVGSVVYVPRSLSDEFDSQAGSFYERKVDQPWNDRTVHDLPFDEILKVVKKGKITARVMTTALVTVLVSRELADAFESRTSDRSYGMSLLKSMGLDVQVVDTKGEGAPEALVVAGPHGRPRKRK